MRIRNFAKKQGLLRDSARVLFRGLIPIPKSDNSTLVTPPADAAESGPDSAPPKAPQNPPIDREWAAARAAFAAYGKHLGKKLGKARRTLVKATFDELGENACARAVHGYRWRHRGPHSNGFDPERYFTPESILRPANRQQNVEAYDLALAAGAKPPFIEQPSDDSTPNGPTAADRDLFGGDT